MTIKFDVSWLSVDPDFVAIALTEVVSPTVNGPECMTELHVPLLFVLG